MREALGNPFQPPLIVGLVLNPHKGLGSRPPADAAAKLHLERKHYLNVVVEEEKK
jgi:hypothetical protein